MKQERKGRENYHHNINKILRKPKTGERRQGTRTLENIREEEKTGD